jgi:chorismate lyase
MSAMPPEALQWMPSERLGSAQVEPHIHPWLIGQGLLSERLREIGGDGYALKVACEYTAVLAPIERADLGTQAGAGLVREVALQVGGKTWVYAQTLVPDDTLKQFPWLGELGEAPIGQVMAGLSGVERRPYEFVRLPFAHPLAQRALEWMDERPDWLWARRALWRLRGSPVLVQEIFCPGIGHAGIRP